MQAGRLHPLSWRFDPDPRIHGNSAVLTGRDRIPIHLLNPRLLFGPAPERNHGFGDGIQVRGASALPIMTDSIPIFISKQNRIGMRTAVT